MSTRLLFIKGGLLLASLIATAFTLLLTAQEAHAGEVSCGAIQCNVTSSQYAQGTDSSTPPQTGGGGYSGGGGSSVAVIRQFTQCATWYGMAPAGFLATSSYPDPTRPGEWLCRFERGMTDVNAQLPQCSKIGDRIAYGMTRVWIANPDGSRGDLWYTYCNYPSLRYVTPTVSYFTRPTGGVGDFLQTGTTSSGAAEASVYGAGGTLADSTGYRGTGFDSGNPAADVRLDQSFNAKTALTPQGQPRYGFYRLQWRIDWVEYRLERWHPWLGKADVFTQLRTFDTTQATPYTYACNLNPALAQGVISGANFDPAQCARSSWQCDVTGDIQVQNTSLPVQVMRDGTHLPVTFPRFDVNGSGVRNTVKSTISEVDTSNITPVNGSDPNWAKQYFDAEWTWNTWTGYDPNTKWLAFYWTTDQGKPFSFDQRYRFSGQFYVPVSGSINSPTYYDWVDGAADCGISKTSNQVTVLRSAGG